MTAYIVFPRESTKDPAEEPRGRREPPRPRSFHDIRARETKSFAISVGEMEQQFLRPNEKRRLNVKMLSEMDNVVQSARKALVTSRRLLKLPYAPNDLRGLAHLCVEEAEAATETAVSRDFASRALLLAQLAEVIAARLKDKPAP
jgi:hypothetical protein